jgi:hypothetical protein
MRRLQAAASGLVVGAIFWTIIQLWNQISKIEWHLNWGTFILSTSLLIAALMVWPFAWVWFVGKLEGNTFPIRKTVRSYIYANTTKYIPGSVYNYFARAYFVNKIGYRPRSIWAANIFEFLAAVFTGLLLYSLSLLWPHVHVTIISTTWTWGLVGALLILISPPVLNPLANLIRKNEKKVSLDFKTFSIYLTLSCFIWIMIGVAFWVFLASFNLGLPIAYLPESIGVWSIAVAIGMIAIGFPQGIGVKEAILVYGLSFMMPLSQAIPTALLSRAWIIAGDLLSLFIWWLIDSVIIPIIHKTTRG